jgi:thiol-disulfide isomerase/thioredoxin/antitoxin component of RelBE/YafQ-DinJ toxin-antitoxin module
MKILYLFLLLVLDCSLGNAQKLKLNKGQKLTYEYLNLNSSIYSKEFKNLNYSSYQYDVVGVKKGIYLMRMQPGRRLSYSSAFERIDDSNNPQNNPGTISTVINEELMKYPITFDMDTGGNVLNIFGLDTIKNRIIRRTILEKTPQPPYSTDNKEFIEYSTNPSLFINQIHYAFKRKRFDKVDSTYSKAIDGKPEAAIVFKKESVVDPGSGVTNFFYKDSLARGIDPKKSSRYENHYGWWFSIKSSNIAGLKSTMDLLTDFANQTNLKTYNMPEKKVIRAVDDLAIWYGNSKGQIGIDEIATRKLDSLAKLVNPDNHEFNAAALGALKWFDYERKMKLIEKVPLAYLRTDDEVADKATKAYEARDIEAFTEALKLMFTKFAQDGKYPLNVEHIAQLANSTIAADILSDKTSRADLLKIRDLITAVMKLDIPNLSSIFEGIYTYVRVTAATSPKEVEAISAERFNSMFSNFGRYRLLTYDRMKVLNVADSVRTAYLDYSMEMFRNGIEESRKPFEGDPIEKYHHSSRIAPLQFLLRKQLADAYYRKSIDEPKKAISYLQLASDYLPKQDELIGNTQLVSDEYPFLTERNYTALYLNAAGASGISPIDMLKKYVDMVIVEPERYPTLKEKYLKAFPNGDFKKFFQQMLKEKLPASPKFNLTDRKGIIVTNASSKGKYVFIDFWGTWCGACVAEIDKIEDLHVNNPAPDKLAVTTIACYDKTNLVDAFMEKKKFSYQVLMSDNKVEQNFKVASYPTKLLLLPNDVFVLIPSSMDYKAVVKRYVSWEL